MKSIDLVSRRCFLVTVGAAPIGASQVGLGPVVRGHGKIWPPQRVPDIELTRHDGVPTRLAALVSGHVTAVQLMFTSCTTTCPMGAATFQQVQKSIPSMGARRIQLLSLSIDPREDVPKAMMAWRRRFHAGPNWMVGAPTPTDAGRLQDFFQSGADSSDHSTQVHIINRDGCLVWRTYELPTAEEVSSILLRV